MQRAGDVVDAQCYMMQSFAALFEKSAHRRIIIRGLQQLDVAFVQRNHRDTDLLMLHRFFMLYIQAQRLIKAPCRLNAVHGNAQMVDFGHQCAPRASKTWATRLGTSRYGSSSPDATRSACSANCSLLKPWLRASFSKACRTISSIRSCQ